MGISKDLEEYKKSKEAYKNSTTPNQRRVANVILIVLAVLFWRGCIYESKEEQYVKDVNDKKIMAVFQSHEFVKKRLKAPSTADFQNIYQAEVKDEGNNTYRVVSYVDAENSFGAKLRMNYDCKLRYTNDGMVEVLSMKLDD